MRLKKYYKYLTIICILLILFILITIFESDLSLTKEKKTTNSANDSNTIYNIALITDKNCSEAKQNQICQALDTISEEFDKTYAVFDISHYNNSYENTITAATGSGASLIICPDSSFEETIYNLQTSYVNVYFLMIDGIPHNSDYSDTTINYNVIPLMFDEADIGFFAGYALAYDGYRNIAFAGLEDSSSSQYFYGLLNGINYASQTLNINDITINYGYVSEETTKQTIRKISDTSEVIVAAGNTVIEETIAISEEQQKPCIICSDNYSLEDDFIIAAASKNITTALYDCLYNFYSNNITGGISIKYSATNNSIGLIFDNDSFKTFHSQIYDSIYQELAEDKIIIISDTTIPPEELGFGQIQSINCITDSSITQ